MFLSENALARGPPGRCPACSCGGTGKVGTHLLSPRLGPCSSWTSHGPQKSVHGCWGRRESRSRREAEGQPFRVSTGHRGLCRRAGPPRPLMAGLSAILTFPPCLFQRKCKILHLTCLSRWAEPCLTLPFSGVTCAIARTHPPARQGLWSQATQARARVLPLPGSLPGDLASSEPVPSRRRGHIPTPGMG